MMLIRLAALAALLYGAFVLLRRTGWTARERQALLIIAVASAVILAGAVLLSLQSAR